MSNEASPPKPGRIRKIIIVVGCLYLLYLIGSSLLVPWVISRKAIPIVVETLERNIELEKASFNPFTLSTTLEGLMVEDDLGRPFFQAERIFLNPQISSVFGTTNVKAFALEGAEINLSIESNGDLNIQKLATMEGEPDTEESEEPADFWLGSLLIANMTITFEDKTRALPFKETITPINVNLENLHTSREDNDSPYSFLANIGDETTIEWRGDVSAVPVASNGSFRIENLDIAKSMPYAIDYLDLDLSGALGFSGTYTAVLEEEGMAMELTEGGFTLNGLKALSRNDDSFEADFPSIAVKQIEARWPQTEARVGEVAIASGYVKATRGADGEMVLPVKSFDEASFDEARDKQDDADVSLVVDAFSWTEGVFELVDQALAQPITTRIENINISGSQIEPFNPDQKARIEASLALAGESGVIEIGSNVNIAQLEVDAEVAIKDLKLAFAQGYADEYAYLNIVDGVANAEAQVQYREEAIKATANATVARVEIADKDSSETLAAIESLKLAEAVYDGDAVQVATVELVKPSGFFKLDDDGGNWLKALRIELEDEPFDEASLDGARDKQGETDSGESISEVEEDLEEMFPFTVGKVLVTEGTLDFLDTTVEPPFRSNIEALNTSVGNLSSLPGTKAAIDVTALIDGSAQFEFKGSLDSLDLEKLTTLSLAIRGYDMTATSPYWGKFLGRNLAMGMMSLESSYNIETSALEGQIDAGFDQLTLGEAVDSPDAMKLPIGFAINLLKDPDGKITLPTLKLSDRLDRPGVNAGSVIFQVAMKALGNIILKAATSPFSLLSGLVGGQEDVNNIGFAAGQFQLDEATRKKLDAMATILQKRPGLNVELASIIAAEPERDVLKRNLIAWILQNEKLGLTDTSVAGIDPIQLLSQPVGETEYKQLVQSAFMSFFANALGEPESTEEPSLEPEPSPQLTDTAVAEESSDDQLKRNLIGAIASFIIGNASQREEEVGSQQSREEVDSGQSAEGSLGVQQGASPSIAETLPAALLGQGGLPGLAEMLGMLGQQIPALQNVEIKDDWLNALSSERSQEAKRYLIEEKGIAPERLFISNTSEESIDSTKELSALLFNLKG